MHHTRTVAPDILTKKQNAISLTKILERDCSDGHPNTLRQGYRCALVAHIGRVWEIVAAIETCHQRIHVRCFERSAAGSVKDYRFRAQLFKYLADLSKSLPPRNRQIP